MLDAVELVTGPDGVRVEWSVIWLHGLGADGHDFASIVPELSLPPSVSVRFVLPHAPVMRVRINGGAPMRAWYDVSVADLSRSPDLEGMNRSVGYIRALAEKEVERGTPRDRIILAGFSQGGVIALLSVFTGPEKWGGVLALSTYIPLSGDRPLVPFTDNPTPLLMVHGTEDGVIPAILGKKSFDFLRSLGSGRLREWREYPMGHSVCLAEIEEIGEWLSGIISSSGTGSQ